MGSNSTRPRGLQILVIFSIKTSHVYDVSNFDPYPYEEKKISFYIDCLLEGFIKVCPNSFYFWTIVTHGLPIIQPV